MLEPEQLRAARGLLGWSQADLAQRAGVARRTVIRFEEGLNPASDETLSRILAILTEAGITLVRDDRTIGVSIGRDTVRDLRAAQMANRSVRAADSLD